MNYKIIDPKQDNLEFFLEKNSVGDVALRCRLSSDPSNKHYTLLCITTHGALMRFGGLPSKLGLSLNQDREIYETHDSFLSTEEEQEK